MSEGLPNKRVGGAIGERGEEHTESNPGEWLSIAAKNGYGPAGIEAQRKKIPEGTTTTDLSTKTETD